MNIVIKTPVIVASTIILTFLVSACSPEVGSKEWCENIKEKGVNNVTASEAADYAKNCVF